MPEIITLDNGFTIILDHVPHVERASLGIWCRAGSRFETDKESGLSHFLEHMFFRGSQKYTNDQINEIPDSMGVDINAYTSKENTAYHCTGLKEAVPQMIDILTDMVFNPTFPQDLMEIERGAILSEINTYYQNPSAHTSHLADEAAYGLDQSMGQPILGPKDNIKSFQRDDLVRFKEKLYTAPNMAFVISGNFDRDQVIDLVSNAAKDLKPGLKNTFAAASVRGGEAIEGRPIEQLNVYLGCEASPSGTKEALAEAIYGDIMGSGMSSRLHQEVREKRGLVYGIQAGAQTYEGVGEFGIFSAGINKQDKDTFMTVVKDEIKKSRGTITQAELDKSMTGLKNDLYKGMESIGARARTFGTNFLGEKPLDFDEMYNRYASVTLDDVNDASHRMFKNGLHLAAIGPQDSLPTLDEFKKDL
ncbi:MAG: insulinase family protein [Alphaproteobacteria bacterium]|nr:insulinase family protein [Alphaproteobacteria bacterium]MCD8525642.1 insulinase family protein [Alphaproteobacteria bacterium]MCD8570049.1 insulinase family protein [Alphaproteobacteria bacterium]